MLIQNNTDLRTVVKALEFFGKTIDMKLSLVDEFEDDHEFYVFEIGKNFKAIGGVYAFARYESGEWKILYIGETESFKRRLCEQLESHHRFECAQKAGMTHLLLRTVPKKQARLDLETSLRNEYDPPCNRQ